MKQLETYLLREKPELKLILDQDNFEIIDFYDRKNTGVYSFKSLKNIELRTQQINWLFSIFSWIVDVFLPISEGGIYRDKAIMIIHLADKKLKMSLHESDFEKARSLANSMKIKINHL